MDGVAFQDAFNAAIALVWILTGWILHIVWGAVRDMQAAERSLTEKVNSIEVLVAGQYVRRAEWADEMKTFHATLQRIEDKIDGKADKK